MNNSLLHKFLNAPRAVKRISSVAYDVIAVAVSFYLAMALRLGSFSMPFDHALFFCLMFTIAITIVTFIRMGLYRAILRYMTQQAFWTILAGIMISSLAMALSGFFLHAFLPRSVPIIYIFTSLIFIGLPRLVLRNIVQLLIPKGHIKVVIYGAGETGVNLARQLQLSGEFNPIAFVDDNSKLQGSILHGLTVNSPKKLQTLINENGVVRILLALGNISRQDRIRVIRFLEPLLVQVQTIPPVTDIVRGKSIINELRNIQIEDLLGRDPVEPNQELMDRNTKGKAVMITGAGGSIGSELSRQLLLLRPESIVLFEQNEFNLYQIEKKLSDLIIANNISCNLIPILGSVDNKSLLGTVMLRYEVHIVYHAAAYKHVPIVEKNIIEGFKNNVLGTKNVAEAAISTSVKHFVLISTDKAVRPTSVMGATKRIAELIVQNFSRQDTNVIFSMVRFGNVLDSSGSVVPRFREQIKKGGPLTVTHKDVVRYFMTIGEAAQLVIQAGALSKGGEVFVLDMGDPVKILDLAKEMILLSGNSIKDENNVNGNLEIIFTGLRPGEKLYEELLCGGNCEGTLHPRILVAEEDAISHQELEEVLLQANGYCNEFKLEKLYDLLMNTSGKFQGELKVIENQIHQNN